MNHFDVTRAQPLCGLALIALIAYSLSTNRRAIRARTIAWGFGLQFLFAVVVLKTSIGQRTFEILGDRVRQLLAFATVRFDRHTKWALAVAVLAGLATVLPGRLRRSAQTA